MKRWFIFAFLAFAIPAWAERDFLTSEEEDRVREAQEPNARMKLYATLAAQRLSQLQKLIEKDKRGRSLEVRELLEDYANIIDAVDTVSDDALKHGANIVEGTNALRAAENRFLAQLQKVKDRQPADLDMYNVALTEAVEATKDSLDLSQEDPNGRAAKLNDEDNRLRQGAEQTIDAEDAKGKPTEKASADGNAAADDKKPRRKPPTLYRPGEQPDPPVK